MKIRQHGGSLEDSIATIVSLDGSLSALQHHVQQTCGEPFASISLYDANPDPRIGWPKTYLIRTNRGVFGFADQNVTG